MSESEFGARIREICDYLKRREASDRASREKLHQELARLCTQIVKAKRKTKDHLNLRKNYGV
ncbi:hypothetical protein SCACP_14400 [Sporomusa carbonis]